MESSKVYVDVVARFDKDGVMMPMAFVWEDGRKNRKRDAPAVKRVEQASCIR